MICKKCKEREATDEHHTKFDKETGKSDKDSTIQNLCCLCHCKIHGIDPRKGELRRLVVLLTRTQKATIAIDNQIRSFSRIELIVPDYMNEISDNLEKECKDYDKKISKLLESRCQNLIETQATDAPAYPIWKWMNGIKGISIRLGSKIISMIDINKTPMVSSLWQFTGQTPESKLQKGKKIKHNPELKSYMYQLGDSFIITKSPYRKIYDKEKERQIKLMDDSQLMVETQNINTKKEEGHEMIETHQIYASPPKNLMHCHLRAKRKMVKKFLSDLYLEWRKLEGLEITTPYSQQRIETHPYTAKKETRQRLKPIPFMSPSKLNKTVRRLKND